MSLVTIAKLADFYEISLDYFVGFTDFPLSSLEHDPQAEEKAMLIKIGRLMECGERSALLEFFKHVRKAK